MNNQALEFQAAYYKVEKSLKKFECIGLNVTKYQNLLEEIKNECLKTTNDMEKYLGSAEEGFVNSFSEMAYAKAIKNLEMLYLDLSKYEIYVKVAYFSNILLSFIEKENKDLKEFKDLREDIIKNLRYIRKSDTLNYQVNGNLIENVYHLVYLFIKEEIKFFGRSELLEMIKVDPSHKYYIDKEVSKELESLNLQDSKFELLAKRINEISLLGNDTTYIDEQLLKTLIMLTEKETYDKDINYLIEMVSEYSSLLNSLDNELQSKYSDLKNYKAEIIKKIRKIGKNISLFITSSSLITGVVVGSYFQAKKEAEEYKYNVKTMTYGINYRHFESEYSNDFINATYLYKYEPFIQDDLGVFKRKIIRYILPDTSSSDFNFILADIVKYLKGYDLEYLENAGEEFEEAKETLNLTDLYDKAYYEIKQSITSDIFDDKFQRLLIYEIFSLTFIEIALNKLKIKKSKHLYLIEIILETKKLLKQIKEKYKDFDVKKRDIVNIYASIENLIEDNEELFSQLERILLMIENNPEYEKEICELNDCLKLSRKMQNEIQSGRTNKALN